MKRITLLTIALIGILLVALLGFSMTHETQAQGRPNLIAVLNLNFTGTLRKDCGTGGHDIFNPKGSRDITVKFENQGDCRIQVDVHDAKGNVAQTPVGLGDSAVWDFEDVTDMKVSCLGGQGPCVLNYQIAYR